MNKFKWLTYWHAIAKKNLWIEIDDVVQCIEMGHNLWYRWRRIEYATTNINWKQFFKKKKIVLQLRIVNKTRLSVSNYQCIQTSDAMCICMFKHFSCGLSIHIVLSSMFEQFKVLCCFFFLFLHLIYTKQSKAKLKMVIWLHFKIECTWL